MTQHVNRRGKKKKKAGVSHILRLCSVYSRWLCINLEHHEAFKGATMAEYKYGSLKTLLSPDNNDTNFIANFKQTVTIIGKNGEIATTYQPLSRNFYRVV